MKDAISRQSLVPRLWFCVLFTLPLAFKGFDATIGWFLCSLVLGIGAIPFFLMAWKEKTSAATLISCTILLLYLYSTYTLFLSAKGALYFFQSAAITTIAIVGELLKSKVIEANWRSLQVVRDLAPKTVNKFFADGKIKAVAADTLKAGDRTKVNAGQIVGGDGLVISGSAVVDESMLFGTPNPVEKVFGQKAWAGTKAIKGSFVVQASQVGQNSLIQKVINNAEKHAPDLDVLTKPFFVPVILLLSFFCFLLWSLISGLESAILYTSSFLIIASPLNLNFATLQAVTGGAKRGIVIKDPAILKKYTSRLKIAIWKGENLDALNAQVICLSPELENTFWKFYKRACSILQLNLIFANGYTIIALLLAFFGNVSPITAAIAMYVSTIAIATPKTRL